MRVTNNILLGCQLFLTVATTHIASKHDRPCVHKVGVLLLSATIPRAALPVKYGARFRQEFTLEDAIGSHACSA
jgi:hypothetical protein